MFLREFSLTCKNNYCIQKLVKTVFSQLIFTWQGLGERLSLSIFTWVEQVSKNQNVFTQLCFLPFWHYDGCPQSPRLPGRGQIPSGSFALAEVHTCPMRPGTTLVASSNITVLTCSLITKGWLSGNLKNLRTNSLVRKPYLVKIIITKSYSGDAGISFPEVAVQLWYHYWDLCICPLF